MWFIGVEVEQETSAPPPKKNPGSAPVYYYRGSLYQGSNVQEEHQILRNCDSIQFQKLLIWTIIVQIATNHYIGTENLLPVLVVSLGGQIKLEPYPGWSILGV